MARHLISQIMLDYRTVQIWDFWVPLSRVDRFLNQIALDSGTPFSRNVLSPRSVQKWDFLDAAVWCRFILVKSGCRCPRRSESKKHFFGFPLLVSTFKIGSGMPKFCHLTWWNRYFSLFLIFFEGFLLRWRGESKVENRLFQLEPILTTSQSTVFTKRVQKTKRPDVFFTKLLKLLKNNNYEKS